MFKWTTKDGKELKLKDIGDNHLRNISKMLKRQKKQGYIVSYVGDIWGWDCDMDYDEEEWNEENERNLKTIKKEVKKRGLYE